MFNRFIYTSAAKRHPNGSLEHAIIHEIEVSSQLSPPRELKLFKNDPTFNLRRTLSFP